MHCSRFAFFCAIVVGRYGLVDVMAVERDVAIGWPFENFSAVSPLVVIGAGAPNAVSGELPITTSQNVVAFDPQSPLGPS